MAQTSITGSTSTGIRYGDPYAWEKSFGCIFLVDAKTGVQLNGTNVFAMQNIAGTGKLEEYDPTMQPVFLSDATQDGYSTNNFKTICFPPSATEMMTADFVGQALTGTPPGSPRPKPFAIVAVCSGLTNGSFPLWNLGWSQSSNANASCIELRPSGGTATSSQIAFGSTTNRAKITGSTPESGTNYFFISSVICDGTSLFFFNNKRRSGATFTMQGDFIFDQFTVGGFRGTNGNFTAPWWGNVSYIGVFTNTGATGSDGTWVTNMVDFVTANRYPVLNPTTPSTP